MSSRERGYYWISKCTTPEKREVAFYYGGDHKRPWCIYNSSGDWLERSIINVNENRIVEDASKSAE